MELNKRWRCANDYWLAVSTNINTTSTSMLFWYFQTKITKLTKLAKCSPFVRHIFSYDRTLEPTLREFK